MHGVKKQFEKAIFSPDERRENVDEDPSPRQTMGYPTSKTGGLICYASQRPTWREDPGGLVA
jgi:hypothetical protein